MANMFADLIPSKGGGQRTSGGNPFADLIPKSQAGQVNAAAKQSKYMSPSEFATDSVKALGAGTGRGMVQALGSGGTVREGLGAVGDMASPSIGQAVRQGVGLMPGFGGMAGADILATVNDATRQSGAKAPLEYQGKNDFSRWAGTAGEFATGALGPGGPVRKAANVLLPATGAEVGGKITEGTAAEPWARLAGAVAGGGVANLKSAGSVTKRIAKAAPSVDEVKASTDQMYDTLRKAGIRYDSEAYMDFVGRVAKRLKEGGYRDTRAPHTANLIRDEIKPHLGKSPDFSDVDALRQSAGDILREPSYSMQDKAAAKIIASEIDKFQKRSAFKTDGSLPADQVQPLMRNARDMARRNIIARDVTKMMQTAQHYASGYENGLKLQFQAYLKKAHKRAGLTPQEYRAFSEAAHGTPSKKAMEFLGKFGVDFSKFGNNITLTPTIGAGTAYAVLGPVGAAALTGAGTVAKVAARRMGVNAAERARGVALAGPRLQERLGAVNRSLKGDAGVRKAITGMNTTNDLLPYFPGWPPRNFR